MEIIQNNDRGGKLYNCLLTLVDMAIENQKEFGDEFKSLPKIKIAKEFLTIKLCSYRRAGHTSAIVKIVEERFSKAVVVFRTMHQADIVLKRHPEIKNKIIACSPDCLTKLMGLSGYDAIIVDCASLVSQSKIDEIYETTICSLEKPLYIFME